MTFFVIYFYTLTYEYVGKIQLKEKKTKHIYAVYRTQLPSDIKERNTPQYIFLYLHEKINKD